MRACARACAAGCADLRPGGGEPGRNARCGTHSLSTGNSHSLGREGNSAAVLNPANWRNSVRPATSVVRARLSPPLSLAVTFPPFSARLRGPPRHSPIVVRSPHHATEYLWIRIDFCNGDFTAARNPTTLKFTRPPLSQGYATPNGNSMGRGYCIVSVHTSVITSIIQSVSEK